MTSTRAARISGPAVNLHNENPSLIALGKLTPTNPRATLSLRPRNHEPGRTDGRSDGRTVGRTVGRTDGRARSIAERD